MKLIALSINKREVLLSSLNVADIIQIDFCMVVSSEMRKDRGDIELLPAHGVTGRNASPLSVSPIAPCRGTLQSGVCRSLRFTVVL